jgi:hypothetical protein
MAPSALDDKETVTQLECHVGHFGEADGHECLAVVFEEIKPALAGVTAVPTCSLQIAGHAPFRRRRSRASEVLHGFSGSPVRVLLRQPPHRSTNFRSDLGSPAARARMPAPIPVEARTMPSHDSLRIHQGPARRPLGTRDDVRWSNRDHPCCATRAAEKNAQRRQDGEDENDHVASCRRAEAGPAAVHPNH